MKLEISLFKFDKNSDYLPYYTKHFLKIENEINILDILNTINKNAKLGFGLTHLDNFLQETDMQTQNHNTFTTIHAERDSSNRCFCHLCLFACMINGGNL